jgi:hypothetical protein
LETIVAPDIASSNGRAVDGRVQVRVSGAGDVEAQPCGRDHAREDVERHVCDAPPPAEIASEIRPADDEVGVEPAARFADHRVRPLLAELVAVAVEEDVHLLLDVVRAEELRVGAPEDRLRAARTELAQPVEPSFGVRDDEVVLGRVGPK